MLSARDRSIRAGRNGPVKCFSKARELDADVNTAIARTLQAETNAAIRTATLADPTHCFQFAYVDNFSIGILTRPKIMVPTTGGDPMVYASFSDTIGHAVPCCMPLATFQGGFTTLATKLEARTLGLPVHPVDPATVRGPAGEDGERAEATLGRLNFGADGLTDDDNPEFVYFPLVLPMGPGQSVPVGTRLADVQDIPDFPAFAIWARAYLFAKEHNGGFSVTEGGPLFGANNPDLTFPADGDDPFEGRPICRKLNAPVVLLRPTDAAYATVTATIDKLSDDVWATLGSSLIGDDPPVPPAPAGGGNNFTPDHVKAIFEAQMAAKATERTQKEKDLDESAENAKFFFGLLFGRAPAANDAARQGTIIPAELQDGFMKVLGKTKPVVASHALIQLVQGQCEQFATSDKAVERAANFDAHACNTAFANALRSCHFLEISVQHTEKELASKYIGLLHFLPPNRGAILHSRTTDASCGPVIVSYVTDDKGQYDISNSSKMHVDGQLETAHDVFVAVCNLRLLAETMVKDASQSLLLQTLFKHADLLDSPDGRNWQHTNRLLDGIPVHLFQDMQHVLTCFVKIALRHALRNALKAGEAVSLENYSSALDVAATLRRKLVTAITGNSLGEFRDIPPCYSWFPRRDLRLANSTSKSDRSPRGPSTPDLNRDQQAKKPKLNMDQETIDKHKTMGILEYDAVAANGATKPRYCGVKTKNKQGRGEGICLLFITQGSFCPKGGDCQYPHVRSLRDLPKEKQVELAKWVDKTPGYAFRPGKGPAVVDEALLQSTDTIVSPPRLFIDDSLARLSVSDDDVFSGALGHSAVQEAPSIPSSPLVEYDWLEPSGDILAISAVTDVTESPNNSFSLVPAPATVTPVPMRPSGEPTLNEEFTRRKQEQFLLRMDRIDPRIRAKIDQPYGKETKGRYFLAEPRLRHVLLLLWKSGFLYETPPSSWDILCAAYRPAWLLRQLLCQYGDVDFNDLRGYPKTWNSESTINVHRRDMTTAALMHFNGSVADTVRFIGGPHVAAHRDHPAILDKLRRTGAPTALVTEMERIFCVGSPKVCAAMSTEANFQEFNTYGNHATVDAEPEKTLKALIKDNRKGYVLLYDVRLTELLINSHVTPQGIVDLDTLHKNPRPIFDCTFRPTPWAQAINDWTDKVNEPALTFADAELRFMTRLYNERITHPHEEIYLADDDVSGAFRQCKLSPDFMGMHLFRQCGQGCIATGLTFGANFSPSAFDPVAGSRRHLSSHAWLHDPDCVERTLPFLPPIVPVPGPTSEPPLPFCPADPDTLNTGVRDDQGNLTPPSYDMHVDDNLYAAIRSLLTLTVCASACGLFDILGWPTNPLVPTPLSMDKLETTYTHQRRMLGRLFDSRRLTVGMLDYKRERLITMLTHWSTLHRFQMKEMAILLGTLDNHTRYTRWARAWYFGITNNMRRILTERYKTLLRVQPQIEKRYKRALKSIPNELQDQIHRLIAKDKAKFLWNANLHYKICLEAQACVKYLLDYVQRTPNPFETHLGLIVPRVPHFESLGDACTDQGGGAFCNDLEFWFEIRWSSRVLRGCTLKSSDPEFVHINSLEFIVLIVQLAAVIERLNNLPAHVERAVFPLGRPFIPVGKFRTDNTVSSSWESKATAASPRGQQLICIYSELLRSARIHTQCSHIAAVCEKSKSAALELFPAESRPVTSPALDAVLRAQHQPSRDPKAVGTFRSRVLFYLRFAESMRWTDDLLLENIPDRRRGQFQLAMYAVHLSEGNSIYCRTLKPATIKNYVHAAAKFLAGFSDNDYRKDNNTDKGFGHILKPIYDDLDQYEMAPNRREPYTPIMHAEAKRRAARASVLSPLGKTAVLANGFAAGLGMGARLSEWAQPNDHTLIDNPNRVHYQGDMVERAFLPDDFVAVTTTGRRIQGPNMWFTPVSDIQRVKATHRLQKNGAHGEVRDYERNDTPDGHCMVRTIHAQMGIYLAISQLTELPRNTPLFCYWDDTTSTAKFITSRDIESFMQDIAATVYDLDPNKETDRVHLKRWGAHSLRVGACVILHAMGFQPLDIQWLLRWKSLAFMAYLRNTAILANRQNAAIDRAMTMPHLF